MIINLNKSEVFNLLQIWIEPSKKDLAPEYNEKKIHYNQKEQLLVSPRGRDNSIKIYQEV